MSTLHLTAGGAGAQPEATPEPSATTADTAAERRLLGAYADEVVGRQIAQGKAPGALLVLVAEGKLLLLKGYGWADSAARRPVDPRRTVFHLASIAKALTATAVLQLGDRGQLDLHTDINRYLSRLHIESPFSQPITAHHLLTHSAGFDGSSIGRTAAAEPEPLADYLVRRLPPAIRPAGLVSIYSDHGYALAGLLVEEIARQPLRRHLRDHLFRPLGMRRTSLEVTPLMQRLLARGYDWQGGAGRPVPLEHIRTGPASMLLSTGADMACWMIALLEGGVYRGHRILQAVSARRQLSRQFSNHPLLPGRSYGLSEGSRFEPPEFHHAASASGFTSALILLPAKRTGLLVSFNSRTDVWETVYRLLERFAEEEQPHRSEPALRPLAVDLSRFGGYYRDAEVAETTIERLSTLLQQERVETVPGGIVWQSETYSAIDPLAFRRRAGTARLGFVEEEGRPRFLSHGGSVQVKLAWLETRPIQLGLWVFFATAFFALARGWVAGQIPRRRRRLEPQDIFRPRWPFRLTRAAAALNLAFIVGLCGGLAWLRGRPDGLDYGVPGALVALLSLPLFSGALTIGAAGALAAAWHRRFWTRAARLRFTLAVLLLLAFLLFLSSWNLLGFHL